jgi:dUTP pyrophosphatase
MISFKKTNSDAIAPNRAHATDAGYDLFSTHEVTLMPNTTTPVHTGVTLAIPPHLFGQIASRSGLALRGVFVTGGIIDPDYRGEIVVILNYMGSAEAKPITLSKGSKVAQILFMPRYSGQLDEVVELDENTERGSSGFGSTGV